MKLFRRMLGYLRRYRLSVALSVVCMIGFVIFSTFSITLIMPLLDSLFGTKIGLISTVSAPAESSGFGDIMNHLRGGLFRIMNHYLIGSTNAETLWRLCLMLFVCFVVKNIFSFGQVFFGSTVEQGMMRDIRRDFFAHLQGISLDFYHREKVGNLVSRLTNDVAVINYFVTAVISSFSRDPFLLLGYLLLMLVLSWKLTLFALLVVPFLGGVMALVGDAIRKYTIRSQQKLAEISAIAFESLSGIRVVKAFGAEHYLSGRFMAEVERNRTAMLKRSWAGGLSSPANEILGVTTGVLILWFGGNEVLRASGGLTGGGFMLFLFAMFSTIAPLKSLGQLWANAKQGMAAADRVFQILDQDHAIKDRPLAKQLAGVGNGIRFEDVWFRYNENRWVLREINATLQPGKMVALVGPSGAGKSTLADLLLRFYDPQKGRITIDGVDLRDIELASLRQHLAVVTQELVLFHDSVRNNIIFGMPNVTQERLRAALQAANADDFVRELPEGLDTVIGDRGTKISGGQRQRLAIARAILRDSPILVLDEATSSLDTESERLVQESMERLVQRRTALVIAHRLSTIQHADEIWVMDQGGIIGTGPHAGLLDSCPLYRKLYENQFRSDNSSEPTALSAL